MSIVYMYIFYTFIVYFSNLLYNYINQYEDYGLSTIETVWNPVLLM